MRPDIMEKVPIQPNSMGSLDAETESAIMYRFSIQSTVLLNIDEFYHVQIYCVGSCLQVFR